MWPTIILCIIIFVAILSLIVTVYKRVIANRTAAPTGAVIAPAAPVAVVVRKQWFFVSHPFWTIIGLIVLWIALTNFATTKGLLTGIVMKPINGVLEASGDAPQQNLSTLPQSRSVGGPLLWDEKTADSGRVSLRNKFTKEEVSNGLCFWGFIPPAVSINTILTSYEGSNFVASVVDFGTSGGKLGTDGLNAHAVTKDYTKCVVRRLEDLSGPGRSEDRNFNNKTGLTSDEGLALNEMYVQFEGTDIPSLLHITRNEPRGISQYVLDVGTQETQITIPQRGWRRMWIGAVHQSDYQSRFLRSIVPAEGIDLEEAYRLTRNSETEVENRIIPILEKGEGFEYEYGFQALLLKRNGETVSLSESVLLSPEDTEGSIYLRLNTPTDNELSVVIKPARIIVGIEM